MPKKSEAGIIPKNAKGYNYKYTDLAKVNEYVASQGWRYYQYLEPCYSEDKNVVAEYVFTVIEEKDAQGQWKEMRKLRGSRVPKVTLSGGKENPAQELGSALTYARRYSLYMALGLATDDDDAEGLTTIPVSQEVMKKRVKEVLEEVREFDTTEGLRIYTEALEVDMKKNKVVVEAIKNKCLELKQETDNG